ncbi:putative Osiris, partial [Operophtera brumata]
MNHFIILTFIASCVALPTDEVKTEKRVKDCSNGILNPTCLKIGAITLMERLNKKDEVSLFPGVSLVKEAGDKTKYETVAAEFARSLTGTDEKLDKYLLYHVGSFLDTHSVKFRLLDESSVEEASGVMGEARAKNVSTMYRIPYIFIIACVFALPNPENLKENVEIPRSIGKDCSNGIFSPTCLKIEAISLLEKLSSKDEIRLLPGISVVKESTENGSKAEEFAAELARALPTKPDERLDKFLLYKLGSYLDSHTVRLRLLDDTAAEEARSLVGEAR